MSALFSAAWEEVRKPRRDGKVPRDYGQWGILAISESERAGKGHRHEYPQGARALREGCLI